MRSKIEPKYIHNNSVGIGKYDNSPCSIDNMLLLYDLDSVLDKNQVETDNK